MSSVFDMEMVTVFADFMIAANNTSMAVLSYYNRSLSSLKAFAGQLNTSRADLRIEDNGRFFRRVSRRRDDQFETYFQPVVVGKEKYYHALSINKAVNDRLILCEKGNEGESFYNFLMAKFDLPLMKEWGQELFYWGKDNHFLESDNFLFKGSETLTDTIPVGVGKEIKLDSLIAYESTMTEAVLKMAVTELFEKKKICIVPEQQEKLNFGNMDDYFKEYGSTMVKNLEDQLNPLCELDGETEEFTLNNMRLYPQQIAQIHGDVALLEHGRFAIANHGMGTGKTILTAGVAESFFVRKWLRSNRGKTLRDAYEKAGVINYRNIVMCPGHLVAKWAEEIKREVPYAKVTILNDFSQLVKVRDKGIARNGKEWFVISKDFGKLSYQYEPIPKKLKSAVLKEKRCKDCGKTYYTAGHTCPDCGSREYMLVGTSMRAEALVCPCCNEILLENREQRNLSGIDPDDVKLLGPHSFLAQKDGNSRCYYCESELWQPHVANIGTSPRKKKWVRVTRYSNKAHKGTKTEWLHKDYLDSYFESIGEKPLNIIDDSRQGARKYSPTTFIQKYMKGYFDIAVFDECHLYKGAGTGQGHAMHSLVKASKKQLALTGTIAGGYANHIYYLMWRLDPQRMVKKGYTFESEMEFADKYGKVERQYQYNASDIDSDYNASCRGRQTSTPRVKPGISPLIFTDFLLDRTTFLDLTDMSKYLPSLKENVVLVKAEGEQEQSMMASYRNVVSRLTAASRDKASGGKGLLSTMLQFSLSYIDKPFGVSPILSPVNSSVVAKPSSFDMFKDISSVDNLLSKERKLVEIVNKELSEGRNCFVYAEYTGSPETCITGRLKEIIEKYCNLEGQVEVLESSSPKASEREQWMHKMAAKGTRVFITNPKCVETGLDFCFKENGEVYNYPTIIFYQLGYSLFTIWQASRRHYRLNQREECRTYYMAWEGTVQQEVISLIAEKQSATSAIQGKFSTEGLASMANGTDARMRLAQSLSGMDTTSGNDLQEMFDVLGDAGIEDETYLKYKPMKLFKEIIGEVEVDEKIESATFDEIKSSELNLFSAFGGFDMKDILAFVNSSDKPETSDTFKESVDSVGEVVTVTPKKSRKRKSDVSGQLSLLSFM